MREIFEQGYAVRFRPQAHFTSVGKAVIGRLNHLLSVKGDGELVPLEIHPERVPLARRYLGIDIFERNALALDRVVNRQAVFQGVGPGDVVVVSILATGGIGQSRAAPEGGG